MPQRVCPQTPSALQRELPLFKKRWIQSHSVFDGETVFHLCILRSPLRAPRRLSVALPQTQNLLFPCKVSLQTIVPTPAPHRPPRPHQCFTSRLLYHLHPTSPATPPKKKSPLESNQVLSLTNSLIWGKFSHSWDPYNAFCMCYTSPYSHYPSSKMYLVNTLMLMKALL